ncbi:MAG TPA: sigma-70 family RNA polymerase sigma factor [Chthonomonadaceae bacterium]|nr:sigma-70 family RNA polymerase sigma factor [Chthonomonadaceae bacterium]
MAMQQRLQYLSDRELVGIARLGSLEAYDELVGRFRGAVLFVAEQILGSREMAQDVAQEAFLLAFRSLPQLQDPAKFASWLYAITRHRARRVATREGHNEAVEASSLERLMTAQGGERAASPLEAVLRSESQASVCALLDELAPELQIVLHLFYYEQWPAVRIAEFLSLPLTTVKWRLRSGREQLRRRLVESLEEKTDARTRPEKRDTTDAQPAAKDGGDGRARRANRQLRERGPQLRKTVQFDCGVP